MLGSPGSGAAPRTARMTEQNGFPLGDVPQRFRVKGGHESQRGLTKSALLSAAEKYSKYIYYWITSFLPPDKISCF